MPPKLSHDSFFKSSLRIPQVALEFMQEHLPTDIASIIELETLKIEPGSFVKDSMRQKISDILFSCKTKESSAYIYTLCEHQSSPDPFMPLRIQEYTLCIWQDHLKKFPSTKKLPIVITLVFYNGRAEYNAPTNLCDLFEQSELARQYLHNYKLIDISKKDDIAKQDTKWLATMEFFMKNAFEKDILQLLQQFTPILQKIAQSKQGVSFIENILWYNITKLDQQQLTILQTTMRNIITNNSDSEEVLGSLVSSWLAEGKAEGMAEGMAKKSRQIAQNLLKLGLDLQNVAEATGLSINDVKAISRF